MKPWNLSLYHLKSISLAYFLKLWRNDCGLNDISLVLWTSYVATVNNHTSANLNHRWEHLLWKTVNLWDTRNINACLGMNKRGRAVKGGKYAQCDAIFMNIWDSIPAGNCFKNFLETNFQYKFQCFPENLYIQEESKSLTLQLTAHFHRRYGID